MVNPKDANKCPFCDRVLIWLKYKRCYGCPFCGYDTQETTKQKTLEW